MLVQVDDNERADALIRKLDPVAGMRVIGLFGRPTKFCEDSSHRSMNERSVRGPKYGWWHCTTCGKPKRHMFHTLTNLLDPETLVDAVIYRDIFFNVREPYDPPLEKYGADRLTRQAEDSQSTWRKLERANDPQVQARRVAARERRRAKKERKGARV